MSKIYIDTNDSKHPRFTGGVTFFSIEYPATPELRDRMLILQRAAMMTEAAVHKLAEYHLPHEQATKIMEVLWHEVEGIVRPYVGASAETKQSARDTEAPTSAPSDDSSAKQESRSSMKRKAFQST
jgi:hypothetical protein